ncbi:MAG TPA: hypothetical protein PLU71_03115 [Candidatus Dependentiae bacterium]|nr:hypothetical protein [Candidatus Dependentiae bacterium]HRQ62822.1 hypothetical protein [Candidatus Dependentiae bacterium]
MKKNILFSYEQSSLVYIEQLQQIGAQLQPEINRIVDALECAYDTPYAFINLSRDIKLRDYIHTMVAEKKKLNPTVLVVIGIGGSNLGTIAVHEALCGKFYNEQQPDIKVYFADSIDTDYIYDIVLLVEQELEQGSNVLINVVSKSGSTTETVANFELFLYLLKRYKKDTYHQYVVVTTDEHSKLWEFAQEHNFTHLIIPAQVGGRYAVMSAVSLFPLALLGVDIDALHAGAQSMIPTLIHTDLSHNISSLSAAWLAYEYQHGKVIHDTFIFSVDLEGVGKWYRQLMGESLGKPNAQGKPVGMMPTVSIGSIDLHSVAQLYLGGPINRCTTFISVAKNKSQIVLPRWQIFDQLVAKLQGKSFPDVMEAIMQGVQRTYTKKSIPFVSVVLPEKSAYYIGQLLQVKMLEMIYLCYLLGVNPFDQPHVELYKKETREILAHE